MQRPARRHYPTVRPLESKYAFTLTIKCDFIPLRSGRRYVAPGRRELCLRNRSAGVSVHSFRSWRSSPHPSVCRPRISAAGSPAASSTHRAGCPASRSPRPTSRPTSPPRPPQQRRGLRDPLPHSGHLPDHRGTVRLQESRAGIEVRVGEKLDARPDARGRRDGGDRFGERRVAGAETRGSTGQTIGEKTISMMPLSDGNPFALARLAPGIAYNGDLKFSRPFDNAGTSGIVVGGAPAATNSRSTDRPTWPTAAAWRSCRRPARCRSSRSRPPASTRPAATPPARRSTSRSRAAPTPQGIRLHLLPLRQARGKGLLRRRPTRPSRGSTTSVPGSPSAARRIPAYDGHDKTFFFAAVEWLYDTFPEPLYQTVPTQAMRNGDFSALLAQGIQIYNPRPAQTVGARGGAHSRSPATSFRPNAQPDRAEGAQLLSAAEPAGERDGAEQLLLRESAHGRLQLGIVPLRPHADSESSG